MMISQEKKKHPIKSYAAEMNRCCKHTHNAGKFDKYTLFPLSVKYSWLGLVYRCQMIMEILWTN